MKGRMFSLSYPNLQNKLLIIKRIFREPSEDIFGKGELGKENFLKQKKKK